MKYIVETNELTKAYKDKLAVDHVAMHIRTGEIYGFVGPNGAGKSTILKMFLNLITPTSGSIKLLGREVTEDNGEMLKRMGSIIESPFFYDKLSAYENLDIHGKYMGFHDNKQIKNVLKMVGLEESANKQVKNFSLGMKQRLAIGRAILTRPEFLILDEPINALDPEGIKEMRSLFKKINKEWGTTIIISSHILSEVELIADEIGVIKNGRLLKEISMEEVHDMCSDYIDLVVNDTKRAAYLLEEKLNITDIRVADQNKMRIFDLSKTGGHISDVLVKNDVELEEIHKQVNTLEDYFFDLMGGEA